MHIEQLVTMVNDIAAFFHGASEGPEGAARSVADHLRRYWEPRMRHQIITHYAAGAAGLSALARAGVALLAAAPAAPASNRESSG
jgi:formate dehydrogenase subunit delta